MSEQGEPILYFRIRTNFLVSLIFCALMTLPVPALGTDWTASWITHPTAPLREPVVLHFRTGLALTAAPTKYIVHVSADNRFVLYANGKRVGDGPARGDFAHWRYETFDLAPYLKAGDNVVSATVWNFGIYAPTAQFTDRTAFLVQGDSLAEAAVSTPGKWMVEVEHGMRAVPRKPEGFWAYMAVGPGEELDAASYDWHWNDAALSGGDWVPAANPLRENIYPGSGRAALAGVQQDNLWQLVRDELPHMEYTPTEPGSVVRSDLSGAEGFPRSRPSCRPTSMYISCSTARPSSLPILPSWSPVARRHRSVLPILRASTTANSIRAIVTR